MIFMPAMIVTGQLVFAVADRIPQVNFERTCREATSGELAVTDRFSVCMQDESAARNELAKSWNGFDAEDRTRCARMATTGQSASYIELLTCLELGQSARKIHAEAHAATGGIVAPEASGTALASAPPDVPAPGPETQAPDRKKPPASARQSQLAPQHPPAPPPVTLAPAPEPSQPLDGFLQAVCSTGLRELISACH
jgi:hypothetical protein